MYIERGEYINFVSTEHLDNIKILSLQRTRRKYFVSTENLDSIKIYLEPGEYQNIVLFCIFKLLHMFIKIFILDRKLIIFPTITPLWFYAAHIVYLVFLFLTFKIWFILEREGGGRYGNIKKNINTQFI